MCIRDRIYFSPRLGASIDIFGSGRTVVRGGWGTYRNQEAFNAYALAGATAQGYKTSNTVGQENFALIDNQTPINPPDIDVEVLDVYKRQLSSFVSITIPPDINRQLLEQPMRSTPHFET